MRSRLLALAAAILTATIVWHLQLPHGADPLGPLQPAAGPGAAATVAGQPDTAVAPDQGMPGGP